MEDDVAKWFKAEVCKTLILGSSPSIVSMLNL